MQKWFWIWRRFEHLTFESVICDLDQPVERPRELRQADVMWRSQQGTPRDWMGLGHNVKFAEIKWNAYFGSLPTNEVNTVVRGCPSDISNCLLWFLSSSLLLVSIILDLFALWDSKAVITQSRSVAPMHKKTHEKCVVYQSVEKAEFHFVWFSYY